METGQFLLLGHEMDLTISHSFTLGSGSHIIDCNSLIRCFLSKQPEPKLRLFHGCPNEKGNVSEENTEIIVAETEIVSIFVFCFFVVVFFCCQIEE